MPLNKFAGFGVAAFDATRAPGIGSVLSTNKAVGTGLAEVAAEIHKLVLVTQGGPGQGGETPSVAAVAIVTALGQLRDPLCDQTTTLAELNDRLQAMWKRPSKRMKDAYASLADLQELADGFKRQFDLFDPQAEFEPQRRKRIAELVAFEWKVLSEVDDPDPTGATA